ncbi:MAG: sensor histidine kinase [Bacteroidota bacterium]
MNASKNPTNPSFVFRRGIWADVLFWTGYTLFWHVLFSPKVWSLGGIVVSAIYTFWHAMASYVNLWFLQPRFRKDNWVVYIVLILLLILLAAIGLALSVGGMFVYFSAANEFLSSLDAEWWRNIFSPLVASTFMGVTITGLIHGFLHRREMAERQAALERSQLQAELRYLRSQINPHFLFNALNTIYFMIPRDPERAAETLAGFSDLLRYQLYQSEETRVPLEEELEQLRRYANLARLRHEGDLAYHFRQTGPVEKHKIPPLLLLPLIENAFKHVAPKQGKIDGQLTVNNQRLQLTLRNNINTEPIIRPKEEATGGIGLHNIRRRLELLYPGEHQLLTNRIGNDFSVKLEIPLS